MGVKLAVLLISCFCVACPIYAATPVTTPPSDSTTDDLDKLVTQFTAVFGNDFELEKTLAIRDWDHVPTWLFEIKPRHAGVFVVCVECRNTAPRTNGFATDRARFNWILDIGDRNQARVLPDQSSDTAAPLPIACVGDSIILPLRLRPTLVDFHFIHDPRDPKTIADQINILRQAISARQSQDDPSLRVSNEGVGNLKLVARSVSQENNETLTRIRYLTSGVMEATKAGELNIATSVNQKQSPVNIALQIVPKGTGISVLARNGQEEGWQGEVLRASGPEYENLPAGAVMMREGDQICVNLWGYAVDAQAPKTTQPEIIIKELHFTPPPGPFPDLPKDFAD